MYIIANFKQNKNIEELNDWLTKLDWAKISENKIVKLIICPSFIHLSLVKDYISKTNAKNVYIGSQDVSKFEDGAFTGQVGANQLKDFIDFSIVGHSEARRNNKDSYVDVNKKIENLLRSTIIPIVCFSNLEEYKALLKNNSRCLFAYEPVGAIGTNKPESIDNLKFIKQEILEPMFIYGGSVNVDNILQYIKLGFVNGFLIGSASLDASKLNTIIDLVINNLDRSNSDSSVSGNLFSPINKAIYKLNPYVKQK